MADHGSWRAASFAALSEKPARIVARRLAGRDHAVITVHGGGGTYRREPCEKCPWRKDTVGEFPADAFRYSANTATDGARALGDIDAAMHTFGCHDSGARKPAICAGYILRSQDAIGWRIGASTGKFDPAKVSSSVPLFDNYYEMAVANGVSPEDPALRWCKPHDPREPFPRSRKLIADAIEAAMTNWNEP